MSSLIKYVGRWFIAINCTDGWQDKQHPTTLSSPTPSRVECNNSTRAPSLPYNHTQNTSIHKPHSTTAQVKVASVNLTIDCFSTNLPTRQFESKQIRTHRFHTMSKPSDQSSSNAVKTSTLSKLTHHDRLKSNDATPFERLQAFWEMAFPPEPLHDVCKQVYSPLFKDHCSNYIWLVTGRWRYSIRMGLWSYKVHEARFCYSWSSTYNCDGVCSTWRTHKLYGEYGKCKQDSLLSKDTSFCRWN